MRIEALRRSTAARTAAGYLLLFIFAISLSYATSYLLASRDASARLRVSIIEKAKQVEAQLREPDTEMQEAASSAGPEDVRLIYDSEGAYVGGNTTPIPLFEGWKIVDASELHFADGLKGNPIGSSSSVSASEPIGSLSARGSTSATRSLAFWSPLFYGASRQS